MKHTCPVCGFAELAEPPYDSAGCASFEICPSCGTEFGYDDAKTSHEELRTRWLSAGGHWSSQTMAAPPAWNAKEQLKAAGMKN